MAFTELTTGIRTRRVGRDLRVEWTSALPATTVWQVYFDRALAWYGTDRFRLFPWPATTVRIAVGSVGSAAESLTDYSGSLAAGPPGTRPTLTWYGGGWQSSTIAGFAIYRSAVAGGSVDFTARVAFVPVGDTGPGGWGTGAWGQGGWGDTGGVFSWQSGSLGPGAWAFAVVPVDSAGNAQGSPATTTATVAGPPRPPAPYADGTRLTYTYNASTRVPTLSWNVSPQ